MTHTEGTELETYRQAISQVDQEILALFHQRQSLVKDVALYKQARGMTILQPDQEQRKLMTLTQGLEETTATQVTKLFNCLFEASRQKQAEFYGEFGLLGHHLDHSFSPQIHQAFGRYTYHLWEQELEQVAEFLEKRPFVGLNVTIPYKETVIPFLDWVDPLAQEIGAVNTIVHRNGQLLGYNTDYQGFDYLLKKADIDLKHKKVLVLGHGGAAKMLRYYAQKNGALAVQQLSLRQPIETQPSIIFDSQVIINATPIAMYPHNLERGLDLEPFEQLEAVVDLIYNPLQTPIIQAAQARGLKTANGLSMLVAQAFIGGQLFTDQEWPEALLEETYQSLLNQSYNLILIGMPGVGKTTIGHALSDRMGRPFFDSDQEIERQQGMDVPDIFFKKGEPYFRELESRVLADLSKKTGCVIATGGGSLMRPENQIALKQNGYFIYLKRPLNELSQAGRPLSKRPETLERLYQERHESYEQLANMTVPVEKNLTVNLEYLMKRLQANGFEGKPSAVQNIKSKEV